MYSENNFSFYETITLVSSRVQVFDFNAMSWNVKGVK